MSTPSDYLADLHRKLEDSEKLAARFEAFGDYDRSEAAKRTAAKWRMLIEKIRGPSVR